jgi:hypothetical protein
MQTTTTPRTQPTTAQAPVAILDLAAAAMAERPAEARRIAAAVQLVVGGHVRPSLSGVPLWFVRSQTSNLLYIVHRTVVDGRPMWSCTCPDHTWRGGACKHVLAARLYRRLNGGPPSPPSAAPATRWALTPLGAQAAAQLPPLFDLLARDFRRVDAALWRHHARTGHTHHDCAAMRRADALWREWARALDLALARESQHWRRGAP